MKTRLINTLRTQQGFSLAELLVATAMVGFVLAGVFVALQQGENAFQYGTGKVEVQQNARSAVDRMVHDLRTGSNITAANATSITFDYIEDNGGAPQTVSVTYSLNGTDLQRNQTAPVLAAAQPETLIGGVNTLSLTYYDNTNAVTVNVADIRVVDVRLITQPQATGLGSYNLANQRATFADRVRLRNL
jgi:prepilin-type N-terminal cleavage/methylation domain-containing protein